MAPVRSLSFPQSHQEEIDRTPPFGVDEQEAARLTSCAAFRCIRDLLQCRKNSTFCAAHRTSDAAQQEAWLLQRDITYALILPLLEIYHEARRLALCVRGSRSLDDLELLFGGEARGAFAWLQCFTAAESEWCTAAGCPACHVSYVLQAEPTIRIVLAACRLAQSLRRHASHSSDTPVFDFWLMSLRRALDEDAFWGPTFWKTVEPRASNLERGIYAMAHQCCVMKQKMSGVEAGGPSSPPRSPTSRRPAPSRAGTFKNGSGKNRVVSEESAWLQAIMKGCWTTLAADAEHSKREGPSRPPRVLEVGRSSTF